MIKVGHQLFQKMRLKSKKIKKWIKTLSIFFCNSCENQLIVVLMRVSDGEIDDANKLCVIYVRNRDGGETNG
jgi:hypothetical protein